VQKHTNVSDGLHENITGLGRRQPLNLAELKRLALESWQRLEALANGIAGLACGGRPIRRHRRLDPVAACVELCGERVFDGIVELLLHAIPATLLDFVVEDAEQPRRHLGTSFESVERFEKCHQDILRQVFRLLDREAHAARRAIETSGVFGDDRAQRVRIAATQLFDQIFVDLRHLFILTTAREFHGE